MAKCKICRDKFEPKYFLQKACLNPKCLAEWAKLDREVKADKVHAVKKRKMKDNDKSLRNREAQKAFNSFIRARDSALPCVSCGRHHSGKYDAGHYRSRGAFPELRFNELNCHKQCSPCNTQLSGNISNYRPILLERIGVDNLGFIEGPHEPKKYTCAELKEVELHYKLKLKELIALT